MKALNKLAIIIILIISYHNTALGRVPFIPSPQAFGDTTKPSRPAFKGDLNEYLNTHLQYPTDAKTKEIQGAVLVSFQINTSGAIENATVVKSLYPSLDAEALRVVNAMPAWAPAKQGGTPVSSDYKLRVLFKL